MLCLCSEMKAWAKPKSPKIAQNQPTASEMKARTSLNMPKVAQNQPTASEMKARTSLNMPKVAQNQPTASEMKARTSTWTLCTLGILQNYLNRYYIYIYVYIYIYIILGPCRGTWGPLGALSRLPKCPSGAPGYPFGLNGRTDAGNSPLQTHWTIHYSKCRASFQPTCFSIVVASLRASFQPTCFSIVVASLRASFQPVRWHKRQRYYP